MLHKGERPCGPGLGTQAPATPADHVPFRWCVCGSPLWAWPGHAGPATPTDHVPFRWCVCGSPRSQCWACTSSAPTQAKLFRDLPWGSSESTGMSAIRHSQATRLSSLLCQATRPWSGVFRQHPPDGPGPVTWGVAMFISGTGLCPRLAKGSLWVFSAQNECPGGREQLGIACIGRAA